MSGEDILIRRVLANQQHIPQNTFLMNKHCTLKTHNLGFNYHGKLVVKNLNLHLSTGEVLGLLGVNGAGKSTTLNMLAGIATPCEGTVKYNDQPLHQNRQLQKHLGYLPETPPLYEQLTVNEQLDYAARLFSLPRNTRKKRIEQCIELCDLGSVSKKMTGHLSKGFKQRVGIAQALLHQPDFLILDEPTEGLDPIQIITLRKLIQSLRTDHGVIISSHVLSEIEMLCSSVVILHRGQCAFSASMTQLKADHQTLENIFTQLVFHDPAGDSA